MNWAVYYSFGPDAANAQAEREEEVSEESVSRFVLWRNRIAGFAIPVMLAVVWLIDALAKAS